MTSGATAGIDNAKGSPPDLILLAAELPGMSGYSVCNRIKKNKKLKEVPVLIISTGETPDTFEQHQSHRTPADDYLLKGDSGESVVNRVVELLGPDAAAEELPLGEPLGGGDPGTDRADDGELDGAFDALTAPPSEAPESAPEEGDSAPASGLRSVPRSPEPAPEERVKEPSITTESAAKPAGTDRRARRASRIREASTRPRIACDQKAQARE